MRHASCRMKAEGLGFDGKSALRTSPAKVMTRYTSRMKSLIVLFASLPGTLVFFSGGRLMYSVRISSTIPPCRFRYRRPIISLTYAPAMIAPTFFGEKNSDGETVPAFTCAKPSMNF